MSFSADWLSTRRSADERARNPDIASLLQQYFTGRNNLRVLDLGCGTGANLASTSKLLPGGQRWTMVDNDADLLGRIPSVPNATAEPVKADLASDLDSLLGAPFDLVTASALFDLAGTDFIDRLVHQVVERSAAFFTVLTYDGQESWQPPLEEDHAVLTAFHADQHADKGLGPALGPDATEHLRMRFGDAGYVVHVGKSDWQLSREQDSRLIQMLADGIHAATRPILGKTADTWHAARADADAVRIGHQDLIALPQSG